ncbi:fructose-1,6-bisphosphatase [Enterococcus hirae]|nr:fructose-1,6-bisphosphatase [Enterococcus hirae]
MYEEKYYELLSRRFKNKEAVLTEIINLEAILNLPKGTEHFLSDVHGEYDAFQHVLRNGSGMIKDKIQTYFGTEISPLETTELATLVYYPEAKGNLVKESFLQWGVACERARTQKKYTPEERGERLEAWYAKTIRRLLHLTQFVSKKYSRSKVRKALPPQFAYILEELLYEVDNSQDKVDYYQAIVSKIIEMDQALPLITGLGYTIQRLVVDHLHIVGDIFDRGPAPDKIIDKLMTIPSVDIQWGNHDIVWLGAMAGSPLCVMNVLRISARYDNLDIVEDSYGINLRPLVILAEKYYKDNPIFRPKEDPDDPLLTKEERLQITKIHQAAAILQFKLEDQWIARRPEFRLGHRRLLRQIDYQNKTITLNGKVYPLDNTCFSTIDPHDPSRLTEEEEQVLERLVLSFQSSERLKRHADFLMSRGAMYLTYNGNLLLHGCVPMHHNGDFKSLRIDGKGYSGRELMDFFERNLRKSYRHPSRHEDFATDLIWYLWEGESSSLFGKKDMTTFERYFIKDEATHYEEKNAYYQLRNRKDICEEILLAFGLDKGGHIINGHTPVAEIDGENPVKAEGKMIVIDGGFSKPYHKKTGIAGYTLLYNSYGMQLVAHQPFKSIEDAIQNGSDIVSVKRLVDRELERKKVYETNTGARLLREKADLEELYDRWPTLGVEKK